MAAGPVAVSASRCSRDRKSTRLNSSHSQISYAVFCLKKQKKVMMNAIIYGNKIETCATVDHQRMGTPSGTHCSIVNEYNGLDRTDATDHSRTGNRIHS